MSWSLPRLNLRPQRDRRSSELSVSRPLFCIAIFNRMVLSIAWCCQDFNASRSRVQFQAVGDGPITAVAGSEVARHPADRRDAHARLPMNFAVGQPALQE